MENDLDKKLWEEINKFPQNENNIKEIIV